MTRLKYGDLIYVAPFEPHQIKNSGNTVMRVVCTIPILSGGNGIITTNARPDIDKPEFEKALGEARAKMQ